MSEAIVWQPFVQNLLLVHVKHVLWFFSGSLKNHSDVAFERDSILNQDFGRCINLGHVITLHLAFLLSLANWSNWKSLIVVFNKVNDQFTATRVRLNLAIVLAFDFDFDIAIDLTFDFDFDIFRSFIIIRRGHIL